MTTPTTKFDPTDNEASNGPENVCAEDDVGAGADNQNGAERNVGKGIGDDVGARSGGKNGAVRNASDVGKAVEDGGVESGRRLGTGAVGKDVENDGVRSGSAGGGCGVRSGAVGEGSGLGKGDDEVRRARAYLLRAAEPPAPATARLVALLGPVCAARRVRAGDVPAAVAAETSARREVDLVDQDLTDAADAGARLLVPEDEDWPAWPFSALDLAAGNGARWAGAPLGLWVRGSAGLAGITERAVAVVGSRAASGYGEQVAAEFGHGLALEGVTVISGAAYGIDGAAHRGSLAAGGPTIAVLGCGIAVSYPAGHAGLLRRIAEHGAVISEYPPRTPPARHRFLVRNRLIAALSGGTVVVEAGRRSGSRNTAATAQALGRVLMAVPGPVTSAMSVGCHDLLRTQEACPVTTAAEVVESTGRFGADLTAEPEPAERRPTDGLDAQALRVHEALGPRAERTAEHVAVLSGIPVSKVRAVLPMLELIGLAIRTDSGWRRTTPSRAKLRQTTASQTTASRITSPPVPP